MKLLPFCIGFLIAFYIMLTGGTITQIILAGATAGIIVWFLGNLGRGPFLRVKHLGRQIEQLQPSLVYRHNMTIENIGKRAGNLINLAVKPSNDVKQSLIMVGDIYTKKPAPIRMEIGSTPIWLDCFPFTKGTKYWIDATYEISILGLTFERTKTIWGKQYK